MGSHLLRCGIGLWGLAELGAETNPSGMSIFALSSESSGTFSLTSENGERPFQIKERVVGKGVPILSNSSFQVISYPRCLFTLGQSISLGPINSECPGPWDKLRTRHTDGSPQTH